MCVIKRERYVIEVTLQCALELVLGTMIIILLIVHYVPWSRRGREKERNRERERESACVYMFL